jgi:hypothetical protein
MKEFRITDKISIICVSESTRSGFRHVASLLLNGSSCDSTKICYYNRTWERYEFESVLSRLIEKTKMLSDDEKKVCNAFISKDNTDWSRFNSTASIAKLGEIFCESKKEKNDWKARMLKAGLGNSGLEMPEDWETLDEDTKEQRLNAVIAVMQDVKQ